MILQKKLLSAVVSYLVLLCGVARCQDLTEEELTQLLQPLGTSATTKEPVKNDQSTPDNCNCVGYFQCKAGDVLGGSPTDTSTSETSTSASSSKDTSSTDTSTSSDFDPSKYGFGIINIKVLEDRAGGDDQPRCHYLQTCCKGKAISVDTAIEVQETQVPVNPKILQTCGNHNPDGIFRITGNEHGEALYGEMPWMVALLRRDNIEEDGKVNSVECGGSIIHPQVILTAAHCVDKKDNLIVRAGEWDTRTENELYHNQDKDVKQIIIHEEYYAGAALNDVALLVLDSPLNFTKVVQTICLPEQGESMDGRKCLVSGWGKNSFDKKAMYQAILKKVEQPAVPKSECETKLRQTELGPNFHLHKSFMCAGGQDKKDSCKGDGGGPLACPSKHNPKQYVQGGIVAWGIGCGTKVPSVYVEVALFRTWIDNKMASLNLKTNYAATR